MKNQLLTNEKIEELEAEIKAKEAQSTQVNKNQEELRTKNVELSKKIKQNERENEQLRKEIGENQHAINMLQNELRDLAFVYKDNQQRLDADRHLRAIQAEYDKQVDFYSLVERRIKYLQETLGDSFSNFTKFIEPVTAVTIIKSKIEGSGFDRHLVDLRGLKTNYENTIWKFSERKVKGDAISPQETKTVLDNLDARLLQPDVAVYWNK